MAKAELTSFASDWNKAAAWAQNLGVGMNSIIPVYQLDLSRLQQGEFPMSAAERNRALLAAQDPNNVTPVPSDKPKPTAVFSNARRDLGMIATGLEPSHLITGLFDTVKNTVEDVMHPGKLEGKNLGVTAGNWLTDTLLSFVPGAYDIGQVLKAGSLDKGLKNLASDPLISLLDVMPAGATKFLTAGIAGTEVGARLAEASGMSADELAKAGIGPKLLSRVITARELKGRFGVAAGGGTLKESISVGDRINQWLGDSPLGTSKHVQALAAEFMTSSQLGTEVFQNTMAEPLAAVDELKTPEEQQLYAKIMSDDQLKGINLNKALADPRTPLTVKEAVLSTVRHERYLRDLSMVDQDVGMVRQADGSMGLYGTAKDNAVLNASDTAQEVRQRFMTQFDETDPLFKRNAMLNQAAPQLAQTMAQARQAAFDAVPHDDALLDNIAEKRTTTTPKGKPKDIVSVLGVKRDQALRVFGPEGMVKHLEDAITSKNIDAVAEMAPAVDRLLSAWAHRSVNVDDPELEASTRQVFQAVRDRVQLATRYAKEGRRVADEIDKKIVGNLHQNLRDNKDATLQRRRDSEDLKLRHGLERGMQLQSRLRDLNRIRTKAFDRLEEIDRWYAAEKQKLYNGADIQADLNAMDLSAQAYADPNRRGVENRYERSVGNMADDLYRRTRYQEYQLTRIMQASKRQISDKLRQDEIPIGKKWDAERVRLRAKHDTQIQYMKDRHDYQRTIDGDMTKAARDYARVLRDLSQAVYDHPPDEWIPMQRVLMQKHLMEHERSAELMDAHESRLREKSGWDESRVQELHENHDLLQQMTTQYIQEVYNDPDNYDPEIAEAAQQSYRDAAKSAVDELHTLWAQGYKPTWMPAAPVGDYVPRTIKAMVGKGEPHVDVAAARAAAPMVATRHDVVAGLTKATAQVLQRDTDIEFVEHSLVPRAVTGSDLRDFLNSIPGAVEGLDLSAGTLSAHEIAAVRKMGLTELDLKGRFGSIAHSMPRFTGEHIFLPTGLVKALDKMIDLQAKGDRGIFDKTNQVFRYSILGLSPRYTAHILFGGTFLLALRSTPYMPLMLTKAIKAMREGSIPQEVFRQPAQEGFGRFNYALSELGHSGGKQAANLAIQEDIENVQGILLSKASPFHYLKAAADVNLRFTRYLTRLQSSIAYLDYASRAERRGMFTDEVTGEVKTMTKERAMAEGMHHVTEVFGNLRSMSPFERTIAKNILPFYGWTRHILKYVLTMPIDHPWRAMTLSLLAYENSANVPKGLPERIQLLFFLGSPNKQGQVNAIDDAFMDPLRDVANYASIGGWLQGLNPALLAPLAMSDPSIVYGNNSLYPNVTYDQFYGIETAGTQGTAVTGLEQFVPQLGAFQSAIDLATSYRSLGSTNKAAFVKQVFNDLNIPFAQVQSINVKQLAARGEEARYRTTAALAANAFDSGNFAPIAGLGSVPNPINPDYEITPQQLEAIYNAAAQQYPGTPPADVVIPPPTPAGF